MTEATFKVIHLVGEETIPNLFRERLKSARGGENIEAVYFLEVKIAANQAYFTRRNSALLFAKRSMVVCIKLLSCAS